MILSLFGVFAPTWIQSTRWYESMSQGWVYELRWFAKPGFRIGVIIVGSWLLLGLKPKKLPGALGLEPGGIKCIKGVGLGILFSLPILLIGISGGLVDDLNTRSLIYNSLGPGVFEELFFRAFAFGFLVQLARWGVWPSAIFTGVLFGLAHIHLSFVQGMSLSDQIGWTLMLSSAGAFYAWIYARWGWNLWLIITMHTLLDLCWELFEMDQSPIGSAGPIVGLVLVFVIPIHVTIRRSRRA